MEEFEPPKTLVKVGIFIRDLEKALMKFDSEIQQVPIGFIDMYKYVIYKEKPAPYFLMISQRQEITFEEYNVLLTITSDSDELNQKIYEEFRQKTGISLRDVLAPSSLGTELMGISFLAYKKRGEKSFMDFLKKLNQ